MPESIRASHAIRIDLPVDQTQRLFTPAGETLWVEGWEPRYLAPETGETSQGMVFLTGDGDENTVWTLQAFTQNPHRARYLRVTPATRWGYVDVDCEAEGDDATRVTVSYTLTALNAEGSRALESFSPEPFARMIEGWKTAIDNLLPMLGRSTIA